MLSLLKKSGLDLFRSFSILHSQFSILTSQLFSDLEVLKRNIDTVTGIQSGDPTFVTIDVLDRGHHSAIDVKVDAVGIVACLKGIACASLFDRGRRCPRDDETLL